MYQLSFGENWANLPCLNHLWTRQLQVVKLHLLKEKIWEKDMRVGVQHQQSLNEGMADPPHRQGKPPCTHQSSKTTGLAFFFSARLLQLEESGCHRRKAQSKSATRKVCRSLGLLLVVVLGDTFITASTAAKNVTVKCLFNHRTTNWDLTGWTIFEKLKKMILWVILSKTSGQRKLVCCCWGRAKRLKRMVRLDFCYE